MDYDLYHDESKEAGYWHGMLLVPRDTRQRLLDGLERIRDVTEYLDPVTLKGLDKSSGRKFRCIRAWMSFGMAALVQNLKGRGYPYYTGRRDRSPELEVLTETLGARFILFRVRDGHQILEGYPNYAARVATTFRMGLKGGLHLFADEENLMTVMSFHFDGHQHYGRRLDTNRIVGRLGPLRSQVRIADDFLMDDRGSDHRKSDNQPRDDCQFLQLADLLVGGFRTVLGVVRHPAQAMVADPLRSLAESWHQGPARMRNSRWHKGFCISECYLEDGQWRFSDCKPDDEERQIGLPGI